MDRNFATALSRSLEQTRAGNPMEATRLLQSVLNGNMPTWSSPQDTPKPGARSGDQPSEEPPRRPSTDAEDAEIVNDTPPSNTRARSSRFPSMPDLAGLSSMQGMSNFANMPGSSLNRMKHADDADAPLPEGARLEERSHSGRDGTREFLLYTPGGEIRGLVVMLHGCTQSPADFARGTRMNLAAGAQGFAVAYPAQNRAHNAQGCWNWFRPEDQAAGSGEPAMLGELATDLAMEFGLGPDRVFAAGLSAGGAMAAILGQTQPGIFAAVGIHSGLAPGSACDVISAFAAMRGDGSSRGTPLNLPAIVFHGMSDATVAPSNADHLTGPLSDTTTRLEGDGPRRAEVTTGRNVAGHPVELWRIAGAGHAWSGGNPAGSYAEAAGPDASAEMVRFFQDCASAPV